MRKVVAIALLLAAFGSTQAAGFTSPQGFGERKLAAMIKGRKSGTPVDCITLRLVRSVEIIDGIGILFETNDGVRYLNWPATGADRLDSSQIVETDTRSPDLCHVDVVRLIDPGTHRLQAVINLGRFVPYPRPAT